jgi:hypothetical protein
MMDPNRVAAALNEVRTAAAVHLKQHPESLTPAEVLGQVTVEWQRVVTAAAHDELQFRRELRQLAMQAILGLAALED